MDAAQQLNVVVGLLQVGLGLLVLGYLGRFGRTFPWLAALMLFSLARGANRLYVAVSGDNPAALTLATDGLVVVMLVLLIVGLRRTIGGLQQAKDDAEGRTAEYERALGDYRTLIRHRIANRISGIRGGIQTLAQADSLDADSRREILRMLDEEAERLEAEALDERLYTDRTLHAEEAGLRPRPRRRFRRRGPEPPAPVPSEAD